MKLIAVKVAVTVLSADRLNEHPPVPEHDAAEPVPLQPENTDPEAGLAEHAIARPVVYVPEEQFEPDTVPDPVPAVLTVRLNVFVNVAVTVLFDVIENEHAPVPVQAPVHPVNTAPIPALGVHVTEVL